MSNSYYHIKSGWCTRFYSFLLFFTCFITSQIAKAQTTINLNVTPSNISAVPSVTAISFNAPNCIAVLAGLIKARATGNFTTATMPAPSPLPPLNSIHMVITKVGTSVLSLSSVTPIDLTTAQQTMFSNLLSLLSTGGAVEIAYSIINRPSTYYAGNYTTQLEFQATGLVLCVQTVNATLNLNVQPFINTVQSQPITLQINNFQQFRSSGATASQSITNTRTVPVSIGLKGQAQFDYTGPASINNPNTTIQQVQARLNMPVTGSYQTLSSSYQNLPGATNLGIPAGNQGTIKIDYTLSPAALVSGFMQAGTYSNSIYGQFSDARATPSNPATAVNTLTPLTVVVADLQEMHINQPEVSLSFNQLSDYQNGISVDIPGHLTISKTNPFDVYVKAQSSSMVNGTYTIPVDCLQIGPAAGQASVQTVTLSTTGQKLISGEAPCLDKNYNIRYSIPADKIPSLLGKPPGTYTTTITYSFTAP